MKNQLEDRVGSVAAFTGNVRVLIQFFQLTCIFPIFIKCEQFYLTLPSVLVEKILKKRKLMNTNIILHCVILILSLDKISADIL